MWAVVRAAAACERCAGAHPLPPPHAIHLAACLLTRLSQHGLLPGLENFSRYVLRVESRLNFNQDRPRPHAEFCGFVQNDLTAQQGELDNLNEM